MKTAYICSPYRAQTDAQLDNHIDYAQQLTALALAAGLAPITTHLYLTQVTDDNIPEQRESGLAAGKAILNMCDMVIVGSKYGLSAGMESEIILADQLGKRIYIVGHNTTAAELKEMVREG